MESHISGTTPGPDWRESAGNSVGQSDGSDILGLHLSIDLIRVSRDDTSNNCDSSCCWTLRVRRLSVARHIRQRNPTFEDDFLASGIYIATITATPSISGPPGRYLDVGLLGRLGSRMGLFPTLVSHIPHARLSPTAVTQSRAPSRFSVTPGYPFALLLPGLCTSPRGYTTGNLLRPATGKLLGIHVARDVYHTQRQTPLPSSGDHSTSHQRSIERSTHCPARAVPEYRLLRSEWAVRTLPGGCSILVSYARRPSVANQDFGIDRII